MFSLNAITIQPEQGCPMQSPHRGPLILAVLGAWFHLPDKM